MALTREQREAELLLIIENANKELEFLTDSEVFYDLPLGTGKKNIFIPDFNSVTGLKTLVTDEITKLSEVWYQNYAGYRADDEEVAIQSFKFLSAWLKMQKIHKNLYPALYTNTQLGLPDFTQTGSNSYKWVLVYNKVDNYFTFANKGVLTNSPDIISTEFYFKGAPNSTGFVAFQTEYTNYTGSAYPPIVIPEHESWSIDCWNAIKLMFGPDGSDMELRNLFQVSNIAQTKYL